MKKFRLRIGRCFDVALQAVTIHEMIFTSGLDSSRALSSSSTSELQKISYKLYPNKKASMFSEHPPLKERGKMYKWPVWEDSITGWAPSRFQSLAQQPETCLTTQDPITFSPKPFSLCSRHPWTKADHCVHITWKGQGVFCNMQITFDSPWVTSCPQVQFPESWYSCPPPSSAPACWTSPPAMGKCKPGPQTSHINCCTLQLGFLKASQIFLTPSSSREL